MNYRSYEYYNENGSVDFEGIVLERTVAEKNIEVLEPVQAHVDNKLPVMLNYVPSFFYTALVEFKIIHLN